MFTKRTKAALLKGILGKNSPIYVQYAVTKKCNLDCGMCGSNTSRKEEEDLNLHEIEKLAVTLDKLNIGIILLTGGEPFIRDDISEIISIFSKKGFTVRLQTNGILASEDKIKSAYQAGMREITISLNSLDPQIHDAISGRKGSWNDVINAIARFSQVLPLKDSMLGMNIVVSRQNIWELPNLIKFATRIGFYASLIPIHLSDANNNKFIIRKDAPELAFRDDNHDEIDQIYAKIIAMKKQGYNIYNSYRYLKNSRSFLKGNRINWRCDSPDLYFAISPSGKFLPCVELKTSFSMLDAGFVDLYKSREFKDEIRKTVNKCPGCFYACWPEMTYLCRDPLVLMERIILGLRSVFEKRAPVTHKQCIEMINEIRKCDI